MKHCAGQVGYLEPASITECDHIPLPLEQGSLIRLGVIVTQTLISELGIDFQEEANYPKTSLALLARNNYF